MSDTKKPAPQSPSKYTNLYLLDQTPQLKALMTKIRDKATTGTKFIFYADRVIRILVEKALELLPTVEKRVITPMNEEYVGTEYVGRICGVSIIRAGESMEAALRQVCQKVRIGKILIQRDEATAEPIYMYKKLPEDIKNRFVLLLDPMLATGGSVKTAIELLLKEGVKEDKIVFVNLISCYPGLDNVFEDFPGIRIVTAAVDPALDERAFIVPGLGDFGDRYFRTL